MKAEHRTIPPGASDSPPEMQLVAAARAGSEAAFEALYGRYKRYVYSLCLRVAANPAGAEELTRKTFLTAFRTIGAVRGGSGFFACLHQAVVSENLAFVRSQRRMHEGAAGTLPVSSPAKPRGGRKSGAPSEEPCTNC